MKKLFPYIALVCLLLLSLVFFSSCEEPPVPIKLGDIADVTQGYFGEYTKPITVMLSDYVNENGVGVSYAVSSSDKSVAEVSLDGDKLTVELLSGEGSSEITVSVMSGETEAFTLSFDVTAVTYSKIACIGDSLTYGHSWPEESYPVYLSEELGPTFNIGNFGRNGASICGYNPTGYLKYTEQSEYEASLAFKPDILVIMLGTNDAKDWTPAEPEFLGEYVDLVDSYYQACPDVKILLVTAPPTMENNRFQLPNDVIRDSVVPMQRELADMLGLPLIDLYAIFEGLEGGYDSLLRGDAAYDGVHLSVDGARFVAQLVAEAVSEF
ncbi:MAG: hypothetical protein IJ009_00640 [Clostridia bacterium]|nr:hypothetical protein [Clostridia bacterium]